MLKLQKYNNEQNILCNLIKRFWIAHNDYTPTDEETMEDLRVWTGKDHVLYYIMIEDKPIGFVHLGARGCNIDWLEDLFILPEYQGHGYGTQVLKLTEDIVKEYSDSIYLEVAARNMEALKLYCRNGYNCLNTITIRKDFKSDDFEVISKETILGHDLEVKKYIGDE